jgi:hypothetical protein
MFQHIVKAFSFFRGLWNRLPKKTQDKIIESAAAAFEEMFRAFFRKSQRSKSST